LQADGAQFAFAPAAPAFDEDLEYERDYYMRLLRDDTGNTEGWSRHALESMLGLIPNL
jgi:hypothetical protein